MVMMVIALVVLVSTAKGETAIDTQTRNKLMQPDEGGNELSVKNTSGGSLSGTGVDDRIIGSPGPDRIDGGGGDDGIRTEAGDDQILGGPGNDYLKGGPGNDRLSGGDGDDRYVFKDGDGKDQIDDATGQNLLAVDQYRKPIKITKRSGEYVVSYGSGDEIHIPIETFRTFRFLIGNSIVEPEEFLQAFGTGDLAYPRVSTASDGRRQLEAGPLGGEMNGTSDDEVFVGSAAEDVMNGNGGNDEFRPGGPGGAMVSAGPGNDTYVFGREDGYLLILESGGDDELRFGPGIAPANVKVEDKGQMIDVLVVGVVPANSQAGIGGRWGISVLRKRMSDDELLERFVFADGTIWNKAEIERRTVKVQSQ
jgi:Ca2+-binding RTX toxin-like protein